MKKRLLPLLLCLALALSALSGTALAAGNAPADGWERSVSNGHSWYYRENGSYVFGWIPSGGNWYYMAEPGALTSWPVDTGESMYSGWAVVNGRAYYFDADAVMVTGKQTIEGQTFTFGDDGALDEGWVPVFRWIELEDGSSTGYTDYCYCRDGAVLTGWQFVDGAWYFFGANGLLSLGWVYDNGAWYYITEAGMAADQLVFPADGGAVYYVDARGRAADEPYTGWSNIGGFWQYYRDGVQVKADWALVNGSWYYFTEGGNMLCGVCEEIGGKDYVFTESGALSRGGWIYCPGMSMPDLDEYRPEGRWYYAEADGTARIGWLYNNGTWYYLEWAHYGAMATGWKQIGGAWYWFYPSGAMAADETVAGYSFDASGAWIK